MYSFSNWCFLCARERNADVAIVSLSKKMQEKIGEYSLVNYNLPGCPKNICTKCHKFLMDVERYTKRYEATEKCLMELMKNKNADIRSIKNKYEINDDTDEDNEVILEIVERDNLTAADVLDNEQYEIRQISPVKMDKRKRAPDDEFEICQLSPVKKVNSSVRILNPTLPPKIENKNRLDILTCDQCGHKTSTISLMRRHVDLHIRNEKQLHTCEVCDKKFSNKLILERHKSIHTSGLERTKHQCKDCGKFLSSKTAVNNHVKWYHTKREYCCEICKKEFATKGSLKEHMTTHSNIKDYVCPICNKKLKTASTLNNHIDTHAITEYKCSICDLKLNSKRTLKQHEKVHSSIVIHKCEMCNAKFKRTKTFKEHLMSHMDMRPYNCEFCSRNFTSGSNCRKHQKEYHPEELAKAEKTGKTKGVQLPKLEDLLSMSKINSDG